MSRYIDLEDAKAKIREEWCKYVPMELDINLSFVLAKLSDLPTIEISEDTISRQAVKDYCLEKVDYFRKRIEQVRDQEITTYNHHDGIKEGIKKISYLNSELGIYADFATEIDNIPSVVSEDTISMPKGWCGNCRRSSDYSCKTDEDKTRCPIEEHYTLPRNGFCHLYEAIDYEVRK